MLYGVRMARYDCAEFDGISESDERNVAEAIQLQQAGTTANCLTVQLSSLFG